MPLAFVCTLIQISAWGAQTFHPNCLYLAFGVIRKVEPVNEPLKLQIPAGYAGIPGASVLTGRFLKDAFTSLLIFIFKIKYIKMLKFLFL